MFFKCFAFYATFPKMLFVTLNFNLGFLSVIVVPYDFTDIYQLQTFYYVDFSLILYFKILKMLKMNKIKYLMLCYPMSCIYQIAKDLNSVHLLKGEKEKK